MTRKRDRFWEHAEQLGNRFRCKFCKSDFAGGVLKIKSHLAGTSAGDVPPCTVVPQPIRAEASAAITAQKGKAKSPSHSTASTPLADIQKIQTLETSTTDKGQDHLLRKLVPESSNRDEILRERYPAATNIEGAVSEAFHGEFVKRYFPLLPSDYVWRIVGVERGGQAHKVLMGAGIVTVRDFVHLFCLDAARLRNIMGGGISDAMWKHTWEHAMSHISDEKDYIYYVDEGKTIGIVFNWNFELKGLYRNELIRTMESLSGGEKVYVQSQSKIAYENADQIVEYNPKSLFLDIEPFGNEGCDLLS